MAATQHDLLKGGESTTAIDLAQFYPLWMASQKNNLHPPAVREYAAKIAAGHAVAAPILQGLDEYNDVLCIRTADGRHRLAGAKEAGQQVVHVRLSQDAKAQISALWPQVFCGTPDGDYEPGEDNPSCAGPQA